MAGQGSEEMGRAGGYEMAEEVRLNLQEEEERQQAHNQPQETEADDGYNYSLTRAHMLPFVNPVADEPFITDMAETYGKLWRFSDHVESWTFGVHRMKNYVFLRFKVKGKTSSFTWNMKEKVTVIEDHRDKYIVLVLREVDATGKEKDHCHSLVIDITESSGQFDIEALVSLLEGSQMQNLQEDFESAEYIPWRTGSAKATAKKIRAIWQTLDHHALTHVEKEPAANKRVSNPRRPSVPAEQGGSGASASPVKAARPGSARAESRKRIGGGSSGKESAKKQRKSTRAAGSALVVSSGSALTNVEGAPSSSDPPMEEYEMFAEIQSKFWEKYRDCFLYDPLCKTVKISQCILAKDEYVIRKLERVIVESVKKELVQLGDIKQRQKVCLTPVDANNELLKERPWSWDQIKDGRFMIINGQHSITASQELQLAGCGEKRKQELAEWDAFIVWTLDPVTLTTISKFYNSTNHLDHAQPTWGNQIISCRNIWISCRRPTDNANEGESRGNRSVFNLKQYEVSAGLVYRRLDDTPHHTHVVMSYSERCLLAPRKIYPRLEDSAVLVMLCPQLD